MIAAKNTFIIVALFTIASAFLTGCRQTKVEPVKTIFDQSTKADLVFFYTKQSTYDERTQFYENVLNEPQGNRGYWPRPGVRSTWGVDNQGYEGFAINFDETATEAERAAVKQALQGSPVVFCVYENKVPGEISDLP